MLSKSKLIQQSLRRVSRVILSKKSSSMSTDKPVVVVPVQTPILPDRAGRLALNMVPSLNEIASFYMREQSIGKMFDDLDNSNLLSIAKVQEIKIFPEFYQHWKTNDTLQIHCLLRDVGTKSFNVQFDTYEETSTILLSRNIRSIVVCDIQMKPHPIPKDILKFLTSAAFHKERYFIPQPYQTKPDDTYETSTIVRPSDLDTYYHVNQANYLKFMLDAAINAAKNGAYKSLKQDIAFASVDQIVLDYVRELCLDENVKIETWEDKEHPMNLCFEMSVDSKMAFQGSVLLKDPLVKLSDEMKQNFPRAMEF